MRSLVSHPAVPLVLAPLLPQELRSPSIIFLGVVCSVLPDLDVVGFRFGVPYGLLVGHRGLSHSIAFALFLSACLAWLLPIEAQASRMLLFGFLFVSTVSYGLLDALTRGG
jgi:inner membrane protein